MKPGITPYDRNSRIGLKMLTVNPCNEFIIQNLIRWKIKVEKQGLNQFYTYNLAIQAVRKYPLPILCYQQMKVMEGFGKFFCTSVAKLVRNHYQRGRMPTQQQKNADDKEHEQYLRRQMRKMRHSIRKNNPNAQQQEQQNQGSDNQSQYSQFNDNFDSQFHEEQQEDNDDNQSEMSDASDASSRSNRSYKPKAGSQYYNFLKAFAGVLSQRPKDGATKPVTRAQINTQLYNWKMDKVRQWNKITQKLKQAGYIKIDPKDEDFLTITTKGKDFLVEMEQQQKTKFNQNTNIIIFRKQKLEGYDTLQKLQLLSNTRGSYKAEQQFMNILNSENNIQKRQAEYELASFVWKYDTKILDYMIMRFKVENFDMEQFNDVCIRARNSTCNNVYVIFQYPSEKNRKLALTKDQVEQLACKCRASGFKVLKYVGFADTIKFLIQATQQIGAKISNIHKGEQVLMLGTLQIYNEQNKKLLPICLKQISRKMLQCIPRMSRDTIQVILQKLPSFVVAHNYMLRLRDCEERIRFLMWMLKDFKYKIGTLQMLDDLLFRTSYELQDQQAQP